MANITVLNTSTDLSAHTLLTQENPYTITGLHTFDRDPSAPFAVTSGSAVVANLDADKLDGLDSLAYAQLALSNTFTNAAPIVLGAASTGTLRTDTAGQFTMQGGTTGFQWVNNGNSAQIMTLTNAGVWRVFGPGRHIIGEGGTTNNSVLRIDGGNGAGIGSYVSFAKAATDLGSVGLTSAVIGTGTSSNLAVYSASNGLEFYSNGLLRWGVNTAGDFTYGPSSHIAMSGGTPTIASGFGTGSSLGNVTDYAGSIVSGTGSPTTGTLTFGHTWSQTPACIGMTFSGGAVVPVYILATTTQAVFNFSAIISGTSIFYHCFGV
jgi:hypothetical protein